jgi:hypothetical protein
MLEIKILEIKLFKADLSKLYVLTKKGTAQAGHFVVVCVCYI